MKEDAFDRKDKVGIFHGCWKIGTHRTGKVTSVPGSHRRENLPCGDQVPRSYDLPTEFLQWEMLSVCVCLSKMRIKRTLQKYMNWYIFSAPRKLMKSLKE